MQVTWLALQMCHSNFLAASLALAVSIYHFEVAGHAMTSAFYGKIAHLH